MGVDMVLEIRNLHAGYGMSQVLQGIDLDVGKEEIVSLVGRNGAGRSTLLKAVMGQLQASGSITFNGLNLIGMPGCQIARQGIGYVPEDRQIFSTLSVEQNLLLGEKPAASGSGAVRHNGWCLQDMYALFPQLRVRRAVVAGSLSGGEQQMLALCRTLMGNPMLIMSDEPMEGLAPKLASQVADFFSALKERGVSVLLVEQKLTIARAISQRICVMGRGTIVFDGTPGDFEADHAMRDQWMGI